MSDIKAYRETVSVCIEMKQYSIHTIFCDITAGFWVCVSEYSRFLL